MTEAIKKRPVKFLFGEEFLFNEIYFPNFPESLEKKSICAIISKDSILNSKFLKKDK